MEYAEPTLYDALAEALDEGDRTVKILPLFLSAGGHVSRDIPRMVDSAKIRLPELDIELLPRRAGESKFSGRSRIVVGVIDLLSVWFLLIFSQKPLQLFGTLGGVLMGTGVVVGLVAFYLRFGLGFGFRPFLYLVILLVTVGVILVGVGLLAEMVAQLRGEGEALRRERRG
jgi:hypothetical protein